MSHLKNNKILHITRDTRKTLKRKKKMENEKHKKSFTT